MNKKYYAITAEKIYRKTILVPVKNVKDVCEAIDLVTDAVNNFEIDLDEMEPEYDVNQNEYADTNGIREMDYDEVSLYQILKRKN